MLKLPVEKFPALEAVEAVEHGFVTRVPGIDIKTDRATALSRLEKWHMAAREAFGRRAFRTASQVHGRRVVSVNSQSAPQVIGADALVTKDPDVLLGIYVADCCAIFLADPKSALIGLVHSGRKGSELNIVGEAVRLMCADFGSNPSDIVAQLSPCIRPPFYEVDFASTIVSQLESEGVSKINDSGANTGADLKTYYSYRMEKGKTGRMLAMLALRKQHG